MTPVSVQGLVAILLLMAGVAMAAPATSYADDLDFDDEQVEDTLDKTSNRIDKIMDELQQLSLELGQDEDEALDGDEVRISKRDPHHSVPVLEYADFLDADQKPIPQVKGFWEQDLRGANVIQDTWVGVLKNGISDEGYATIRGTMREMAKAYSKELQSKKKKPVPDFTVNYDTVGVDDKPVTKTVTIPFNGEPFGFYDLREFATNQVDDDSTAADYPFTPDRANRKAAGPRGMYFYGPEVFARKVAAGIEELAGVAANVQADADACARETQAAGCNWGKPRINYDQLAGRGRAVDPNSLGNWPAAVPVCTNLDYDVDYPDIAGKDVRAFVIDDGIYLNNPDFPAGTLHRPAERANTPLEDQPGSSHGTHVSGIIGSQTYGIAPGTQIVVYRGNNRFLIGSLSMTNAFENIIRRHAAASQNSPAKFVVNMSMSFNRFRPADARPAAKINYQVPEVVQGLRQLSRTGIYVTMSAGNNNLLFQADACNGLAVTSRGNTPQDQLMAVGAHQANEERQPHSNQGPCVAVYAPGHQIESTIAGNNHGQKTGTSQAAPHVAGIIIRALVDLPAMAALPTPTQMRAFVQRLAKPDILPNSARAEAHHQLANVLPGTTTGLAFYYCTEHVYTAKQNPVNHGHNPKLVHKVAPVLVVVPPTEGT
ncbi:uncharacterized protein LOC135825266 [Sycon ciliatum]|uniref:uncharacterized protein LOC135825266 n=1 Tax=Sycon ciliatum TaxID=27933 RepID=UPI0031F61597